MSNDDERDFAEEAANWADMVAEMHHGKREAQAADRQLVCRHCKSGDRLRSVETALIAYPAIFTAEGPEYTGEESETYDEGTTFENLIDCRNCGAFDMRLADLVPAVTP